MPQCYYQVPSQHSTTKSQEPQNLNKFLLMHLSVGFVGASAFRLCISRLSVVTCDSFVSFWSPGWRSAAMQVMFWVMAEARESKPSYEAHFKLLFVVYLPTCIHWPEQVTWLSQKQGAEMYHLYTMSTRQECGCVTDNVKNWDQ